MRVRVTYTVEVDERFLRALGKYLGRKSKATGKEVRTWFEQHGQATDIFAINEERERLALEAVHRAREADWVFFLETGFASWDTCEWCGEMKDCRGNKRSQMACHSCFIAKGVPTASKVTALRREA